MLACFSRGRQRKSNSWRGRYRENIGSGKPKKDVDFESVPPNFLNMVHPVFYPKRQA